MASPTSEAEIVSATLVHPTRARPEPVSVPLSIVDATVLTYAPASAAWVFDAPDSSSDGSHVDLLKKALAETLSFYPHWAGQISLNSYPPAGNAAPHTERFRRCKVLYGSPADPGALFEHARLPARVDELIPDANTRFTKKAAWDVTKTDLRKIFFPKGPLPGQSLVVEPHMPPLQIRVTEFSCRGFAIGVSVAHCLADAEALVGFVAAWGKFTTASKKQLEIPVLTPVFDPSLLDSAASGDIDDVEPDPSVLAKAENLPLPRYDWWAREPGNPKNFDNNPQAVIPSELPQAVVASRRPGRRIPWEEWDFGRQVSHTIIHLAANEVEGLYEMVTKSADRFEAPASLSHSQPSSSTVKPTAVPSKAARVSRHDVLLSFVWQLIALARRAETHDGESIWIDTTLGLRARLGLPSLFVGSPILLTGLSASYVEVTGSRPSSEVGEHDQFPNESAMAHTAHIIRTHTRTFDRDAIGAWLHEMSFEVAPQRIWNGFLGRRHIMATSWVRVGIWDVDFGLDKNSPGDVSGPKRDPPAFGGLRWAGPVMPVMDGLVTITEARSSKFSGNSWWEGGVDIDANLETHSMNRTLHLLEAWRRQMSQPQ